MQALSKTKDIQDSPSARPFLKWVGGKRQLLPELQARLPKKFGRYFEPMIGGGALFFSLQPDKAIISDINEELVNTYQVIQSDVEALIKDLKQHKHEEDYFYDLRDKDRSPHYKRWGYVKRASRFIYLNKTCFNGLYRVNSKGQFNSPFGDYKNPTIVDEENLLICSEALRNVTIKQAPFTSVLNSAKKGDFVYFDPPYVPLSTTSNFTSYSKDGFAADLQTELRDICQALHEKGVLFMLSNSSAPLVHELYREFAIEEVDARRQVNSVASKRGPVKEVIVRNY